MVRPGKQQGVAIAIGSTRGLRVAVFTTTFPRHEQENVPMFVVNTVEHLREHGVEIEVVGPGSYRDFGLTAFTGGGLVGNLKRRPWAAPFAFTSMVGTLRRAAKHADLVHANWLAAALVARFSGKPFVISLHGTPTAGRFSDLQLAHKYPGLVRFLLAPARLIISPSEPLAEAVRACGLDNVRVIPYGIEIPETVTEPDEPPFALYAGRLSHEKGIDVIAQATAGVNRVVAGDGPLRHLLPDALGFVSPKELRDLYRRAAVVMMASRDEGLPNVMLEAMAHARAMVATPVGGVPDMIEDGVTGLLVPVNDPTALRIAVERLLANPGLRKRLGYAGRERVTAYCAWETVIDSTLLAYEEALTTS